MVNESLVENTILQLLQNLEYEFLDTTHHWISNRKLDEFINEELLFESLIKINNTTDDTILKEAIHKLKTVDNPSLFIRNFEIHKMLIDGITIDSKDYTVNPLILFIDFTNVENNTFQVCHQVKFNEGKATRIPDIIVYINGLPLVVMELKSFEEQANHATLQHAYLQLGGNSEKAGYRFDIPTLFNYNTFLFISDGVTTKVGTLTAKLDRYNEWKSISGEKGYDDNCTDKLAVNIKGIFEKKQLLDIIKNNLFFILDKNDHPVKIMAQYHQYFGVQKAFAGILKAKKPNGDGKAGILWHTQGSGKSYSMVMLAHKLLQDRTLNVPTIVILTDRLDLNDQLYKTFYGARKYLKCEPSVANSRIDLVKQLSTIAQGGIIFTTIGKFDKENLPENTRTNIVVMTDEAHRGHYGLYESVHYVKDKESEEIEAVFKYGIEKYIRDALPNATFIGFTGTPVSTKDKQTTDIFGDILDIYDMTQSIIDGSTVKLYYESRLAKIWTDEEILKQIDNYYHTLASSAEASQDAIEKSKTEMAKLKVLLEDDDIIDTLARDILKHYDERKGFLNGKAMIVCQTRVAATKLYKKIITLQPNYQEQTILVVTESNKDSLEERELFKDSKYRKALGEEFKKDTSKYKIAIVVDMWLTGFDVPDLDVIYFIKKLKQHNLMQAIARVNRIYAGKIYGLVVDYIGLGKALEEALTEYTDRDRQENVQDVKLEIYDILKEKLSILNEWFYRVDRSDFLSTDALKRFESIQRGAHFMLEDKKREESFIKDLSIAVKQAFVVCGGILSENEKQDVYYYLAIRSYLLKLKIGNSTISIAEMNEHVKNLLADAIKGDEVKLLTQKNDSINIIELLSKEKIEELRKKNPPLIFVEIVKKLLERAIAESRKNNYVKSQEYSKKLQKILEAYHDRDKTFVAEATIVKLVDFAGELVHDEKEAQELGITGRERAFYDALIQNKSAKELLNDETLKLIARELRDIVDEYSMTTDWNIKQSTRYKMRIKIKECLRKYKYPPDYTQSAIDCVIRQAEYSMQE